MPFARTRPLRECVTNEITVWLHVAVRARVGQDAVRVCSEPFKPGQSRGLPSLRPA